MTNVRLKQFAQDGAASNQVPGWDGSKWAPAYIFNGLTLNALTTVGASGAPQSLVGAGVGHVPTWTGTAWTSQAPAGGGGFTNFATVAACRAAATPTLGDLCYIQENDTLYEYSVTGGAADEGRILIANTAAGGSNRWAAKSGRFGRVGLYRESISGASYYSVVIGNGALAVNPNDKYFAAESVYIGNNAGSGIINSGGTQNVVIGAEAFVTSTGGTDSVVIGYRAANALQATYFGNVFVGHSAGRNKTQGNNNTVVGYIANQDGDDGERQCCFGFEAGRYSQGYDNTYVGYTAGRGDPGGSSGWFNVAVGSDALYRIANGEHHVAVGANAMEYMTGGDTHVAIGFQAMGATNNVSGRGSVAIGSSALYGNNSWKNVAIGFNAMAGSTGEDNIGIGDDAGKSINGIQNVAVGLLADIVGSSSFKCVAIGSLAVVSGASASNRIQLGTGTNTVNSTMKVGEVINNEIDCYAKSWNGYSDVRNKKDIATLSNKQGLEFILKLRPVSFYWKAAENEYQQREQLGLIAQEVKEVAQALGLAPLGLCTDDDKSGWSLNYAQFISPLIKAIQQLNTRIEALEAKAR